VRSGFINIYEGAREVFFMHSDQVKKATIIMGVNPSP
jgi:hypothetical protein